MSFRTETWFTFCSTFRDHDRHSTYHDFLIDAGFAPANGRIFGRGETARFPEPFGKPAYLAREASRFIRQNCNHPFALLVNFLEPHMPFFGPRDNQYTPDQVSLPDNFDALPLQDQPLKTRLFQAVYEQHGHSGLPLKTDSRSFAGHKLETSLHRKRPLAGG